MIFAHLRRAPDEGLPACMLLVEYNVKATPLSIGAHAVIPPKFHPFGQWRFMAYLPSGTETVMEAG